MTLHRIPEGVQAVSLARYLARAWPMLPGWVAREALKKRDVKINGERSDGSRLVGGGDVLALYVPDGQLTGALPVLYEDGQILVVDKPAGLPVDVDAQRVGADTALIRARRSFPSARLCHRLDAGTGGVLMLALTDEAEARVTAAFAAREIKKTYRTVVLGHPPGRGALEHYLTKDADGARVRVASEQRPGAVTARLTYAVMDQKEDVALLEIALDTGRTHQIRAQFAFAGYPLVGDDKYGDREKNRTLGVKDVMLWCVSMEYAGRRFASPARWGKETKWTFE